MALSLPRGKKGMIPPGKAPSLCSPPLCAGLPGLLGLFLRGAGDCCLSLSRAQMSPAMSGPSTCSPWMRTSSAWSCPSSFATTSWSVGQSCRDAALQDGSLPHTHLLGPEQKSFVWGVNAWYPAQPSQPLTAGLLSWGGFCLGSCLRGLWCLHLLAQSSPALPPPTLPGWLWAPGVFPCVWSGAEPTAPPAPAQLPMHAAISNLACPEPLPDAPVLPAGGRSPLDQLGCSSPAVAELPVRAVQQGLRDREVRQGGCSRRAHAALARGAHHAPRGGCVGTSPCCPLQPSAGAGSSSATGTGVLFPCRCAMSCGGTWRRRVRATARAGIRRSGASSSWTEVGAASGCSQGLAGGALGAAHAHRAGGSRTAAGSRCRHGLCHGTVLPDGVRGAGG